MKRRKLLTPAYHNIILQNYMPTFNKHAKLLTKVLADQSRLKGCIDIEDYAIRSTLDSTMGNLVCIMRLRKCQRFMKLIFVPTVLLFIASCKGKHSPSPE